MIELLEVFGRSDDGHELRAAFGGLADIDQLHAIGFRGEPFPVIGELGVIGELVIVAEIEAELIFGRGDLRRLGEGEGGGEQGEGVGSGEFHGLRRSVYRDWVSIFELRRARIQERRQARCSPAERGVVYAWRLPVKLSFRLLSNLLNHPRRIKPTNAPQ